MQPTSGDSSGPWQRLLLTAHIVSAVGLVGATATLAGLGISGLRGADPRSVFSAAHLVDAWVVVPLALVALATGIAQAFLGSWGLATHRWVTAKLLSTTLAAIVVIFVLEPGLARSADAARAGGSFATSEFLPLAIAAPVAALLVGINAALGVFKPTGRSAREREVSR